MEEFFSLISCLLLVAIFVRYNALNDKQVKGTVCKLLLLEWVSYTCVCSFFV